MNKIKMGLRVLTAIAVCYTTQQMLEKKADELLDNGGMLNAFTIGVGQMGLSITAGMVAATIMFDGTL